MKLQLLIVVSNGFIFQSKAYLYFEVRSRRSSPVKHIEKKPKQWHILLKITIKGFEEPSAVHDIVKTVITFLDGFIIFLIK